MPIFLFQPDSIDIYEFNLIPIDIHLGIIKMPIEEILHDDAINNTDAIIVETDRKDVLNRIQTTLRENFKGIEIKGIGYSSYGLYDQASMVANKETCQE